MTIEYLARIVVQFVHVFAGILWIGAGFYSLLVLLPSLSAAPPQARGPVMAAVVPRQLTYILRLAEVTIAAGILNAILGGRLARLADVPLWTFAIGLGAALAIFLYVLVQTRMKPLFYGVLATGRRVAEGDAAAAAELPRLQETLRRLGQLQMVVGLVIVFLMVFARFN